MKEETETESDALYTSVRACERAYLKKSFYSITRNARVYALAHTDERLSSEFAARRARSAK